MKYDIDVDMKDYMIQTFSSGYYKDENGNHIPFEIEVTNTQEDPDGDYEEEIDVRFTGEAPNGNLDYIKETITESLNKESGEVVIERKEYKVINHSSGVLTEENGEFYPFSVEVVDEGYGLIYEVIWDDIQPEGDLYEIQEEIMNEVFND